MEIRIDPVRTRCSQRPGQAAGERFSADDGRFRTRLECSLESKAKCSRVLSQDSSRSASPLSALKDGLVKAAGASWGERAAEKDVGAVPQNGPLQLQPQQASFSPGSIRRFAGPWGAEMGAEQITKPECGLGSVD